MLHLNPCYPEACKDAERFNGCTTNHKDVTCPACLSNITKEAPMEITEFYAHYAKFDAEFHPNATVQEIEYKLLEEMREAKKEIMSNEPGPARIDEVIDVMNVSLKLLKAYGIANPLFAGFQKIEKTAAKYRGIPDAM